MCYTVVSGHRYYPYMGEAFEKAVYSRISKGERVEDAIKGALRGFDSYDWRDGWWMSNHVVLHDGVRYKVTLELAEDSLVYIRLIDHKSKRELTNPHGEIVWTLYRDRDDASMCMFLDMLNRFNIKGVLHLAATM